MDIKAYIDSGILELFVLGKTTQEETMQVIELSNAYPEIKSEIEEIERGLLKLAESIDKGPSPSVKDRLMAQLDLEDEPTSTPNTLDLNSPYNSTQFTTSLSNKNRFLIAASLLLFGASMLGNIWLYQKLKRSQNEVASLSSQNTFLTENNRSQETKYTDLKSKVDILLNPNIKTVKLNGLALMPHAVATIYLDSIKNEVYMNASNLAMNGTNEQYQLWAIVDGKPVDAGVFDKNEVVEGIVKMKSNGKASAFAVTIEKRGGSEVPTLDKMVLMGAVI
jgi:hypothetical protein